MFDPVWEELNTRQAAVFLHGSQTRPERPDPHDFLGIPIVEVPHETFKAAASLVVSGRKRKYPNINFILAHLGGSTPFLAPRVAVLSNYMGSGLSPEDILDDFKTFYYDTALSSHESTLAAMQSFVGPDRLVLGTDFPGMFQFSFGKPCVSLPLVKPFQRTWLPGIQNRRVNFMLTLTHQSGKTTS